MKASRAPGPVSYAQAHANKARPLVGKTNVDSKTKNKNSNPSHQEGGKLTKFMDLDDIPDLTDDWGGDAKIISGNPHRSVVMTGPASPRRQQQQANKTNANNAPLVSYHIQSVQYDFHDHRKKDFEEEDDEEEEERDRKQQKSSVNRRVERSPRFDNDDDDDDYGMDSHHTRVGSLKQAPQSADACHSSSYKGSNNGGTQMYRTTAHGHATAPAQATRKNNYDDHQQQDDSDGDDSNHYPSSRIKKSNPASPRAAPRQRRSNADDSDEESEGDEIPHYSSPSKKTAVRIHNTNNANNNNNNNKKNAIKAAPPNVAQPKQSMIGEVKVKESSSSVAKQHHQIPPPLPCDIKEKKPMTEEEKLYFTKEPRSVEFKPYTLNQYKLIKPKEYVEISKMKPDLNTDELVAKRKNQERIKEFSKQLRNFNQEVIMQQPKKPSSIEENDLTVAKGKQESNRQRALEFAKHIPKPKVAPNYSGKRGQPNTGPSGGGDLEGGNDGGIYMDDDAMDAAHLQELEMKHAQNKARMDAIKRSLAL